MERFSKVWGLYLQLFAWSSVDFGPWLLGIGSTEGCWSSAMLLLFWSMLIFSGSCSADGVCVEEKLGPNPRRKTRSSRQDKQISTKVGRRQEDGCGWGQPGTRGWWRGDAVLSSEHLMPNAGSTCLVAVSLGTWHTGSSHLRVTPTSNLNQNSLFQIYLSSLSLWSLIYNTMFTLD